MFRAFPPYRSRKELEDGNRSRNGPGEGWYCWRKAGGCGATFKAGDQAIEGQRAGRVENENPLDAANTIKKMAVKRAEVDAAMRLPGVARFFTQDLEEAPEGVASGGPGRGREPGQPADRGARS